MHGRMIVGVTRIRSAGEGMGTHLALSLPIAEVVDETPPANVHVRRGSYEHVACGDDVCDRRGAGILPGNPYGDRDVVGRAAESNWKEPMETEKQLGPAVVVGCDSREARG
ncbi:hypothetical protein TRAPUB_1408 [Trametes pubescens]|uniref:Uncharacterized protein n=1 Tax=Trametes pubescens TaxID=154538 RepID=A0A1M2W7M5_TRAPU|nr:hypothetical protein TRAPUB_1408 [Trametes pubescens]